MNTTIISHFKKKDPILHEWILKIGQFKTYPPLEPEQYFARLCDDIVSQQLSGKAASTIFGRFQSLFKNGNINPHELLEIPHEKFRKAGLSNAKAKYVKNLAEHVLSGSLNFSTLSSLPDETVISELTKVKGIGRWTAEMFLMFSLAREDVFSHGDLGLKKGIMKIYGFTREPSIKRVEQIVKKWRPHRTYASRILWLALEI